jgi:hypothetical protein
MEGLTIAIRNNVEAAMAYVNVLKQYCTADCEAT